MKSLHILYLGAQTGTCLDRANALLRLGHRLTHIDVRKLLPATPWVDRITWRLGGQWFAPLLIMQLKVELKDKQFDLCHVDNGEWITPSVLQLIRRHAPCVINYNIDDPTGPRDRQRYAAYRKAVPFYDLLIVMREQNVLDVKRRGARKTLRVFMSADEVSHAPRLISDDDRDRWQSDVLFLGTWMPERGSFLLKLIQLGVPLTIRGGNWQKAPEWAQLKPHWKGGPVSGDDYAKAIQCAKVNLGMLSKGNRDLHTTRSIEIPALGACLCAERTEEHLSMYKEGSEAIFWSTAEECAQQCLNLLRDEPKRVDVARKGHARQQLNQHSNQHTLSNVLSACFQD